MPKQDATLAQRYLDQLDDMDSVGPVSVPEQGILDGAIWFSDGSLLVFRSDLPGGPGAEAMKIDAAGADEALRAIRKLFGNG